MFRSALLLALATAPLASGQTAEQKKATLAYLLSLQEKGGAFRLDAKTTMPSLRATTAGIRAIRYFGGEAPNNEGSKLFVSVCYDKSTGGYGDVPGGPVDPILTSIGLMAAVEVGLLTKDSPKAELGITYLEKNAKTFEQIRMAAAGLESLGTTSKKNKDWLDTVQAKQNKDGTFGKDKGLPRDTGSAVACVLRLGGKIKDAAAVARALDAGQRTDGGFGLADATASDLGTTYRVMRTYHMLKKKPARAAALRAFIGKCRNEDGGYGVMPGTPSSVSGTYYAGIMLHWLGA